MKRSFLRGLVLLSITIILSACESTGDTASDNALKTSGTVPGEKTGDDAVSATAGPSGAGAGVRW
jgi:hypothetical protein